MKIMMDIKFILDLLKKIDNSIIEYPLKIILTINLRVKEKGGLVNY